MTQRYDWKALPDGIWQASGECKGMRWQAQAFSVYMTFDWRVTVTGIGSISSNRGPFGTLEGAQNDFEQWADEELPDIVGMEV